MMLPAGIHCGVPNSEYHARKLGVVSKSALDYIARSPAHYKAWFDGALRDESTPALAFGSAFHCAMLEPERFGSEYAREPNFGDCRRKANKGLRDEWQLQNSGKDVLSDACGAQIAGMVESARSHPLAGRMIRDGEPEATIVWADPDTGLLCKSRADYYVRKRRMIVDVKSTMDARPDAFRRDVARYGYHRQDALYRSGFAAIGEDVRYFVFVAVEKEPPYAVGVYSLDAEAVQRGNASTRRDMLTLAECMSTNTWPAYPSGIEQLSVPPWAD